MSYLSRIRLLRHATPNPEAHNLVWSFFDAPAGTPRPFLFREERTEQDRRLYVLSSIPPRKREPYVVETKPFDVELQPGARLRFVLRANPTVKDEANRRHEVFLHARHLARQGVTSLVDEVAGFDPIPSSPKRHEVRAEWLRQQADHRGFVVEDLKVGGSRSEVHPRPKDQEPIQFVSVDYEGVLRVTDPDTFLCAIQTGIGRSRAFGCGLLLVRPV